MDSVESRDDSTSVQASAPHYRSEEVRAYYSDATLDHAEQLIDVHRRIASDTATVRCDTVLAHLPRSFAELRTLYGCPDEGYGTPAGPMRPLYYRAQSHWATFASHPCSQEEEFARRLVDIGTGGEWQPDGIGMFRGMVWNKFRQQPDTYCSLLNEQDKEKQIGFW